MSRKCRTPAAWAIHPGEILKEEFLRPLEMSGYALAKALAVKPQSVNDIVLEKRGISADMALRLSRYFGNSPEFWTNLQSAYELGKARKALKKQLPPYNRGGTPLNAPQNASRGDRYHNLSGTSVLLDVRCEVGTVTAQ